MFGLAFQNKLKKAFILTSPNFLQFQDMFLQAGHKSETDIYFGNALDDQVHGFWDVSIQNLAVHVDDWLGEQTLKKTNKSEEFLGSPKIFIRSMGGFANKMLQYIAAHGIQARVPEARILNARLPEWGIDEPDDGGRLGRAVGFGDQINRLNVKGLASCLARGVIDAVVIDSYAQHFDNYPDLATCRALFKPPQSLDLVTGYGPDQLVISIRGGEILDGRHPDYVLLPPSFYDELIHLTGLKPVFFGQIEDNAYCLTLRARFPKAQFVEGQGGLHDFEVLRRSCNIVPSISTYSWLAAWLSEAEAIFMPVAGLFNPRQARAHNFLPLDDRRFRFYLFPLSYAVDIEKYPAHFAAIQKALDGAFRLVSAARLGELSDAAPIVPRRLEAYLHFYDEEFYLAAQPDIKAAVEAGHFPSGLQHYIEQGFREERSCFSLNKFSYAMNYPIAASEVANGEYLDLAHHYVEIGHSRGYQAG